jgi:acetyl-CoA carboxylase biotin carboxyl carrier protein
VDVVSADQPQPAQADPAVDQHVEPAVEPVEAPVAVDAVPVSAAERRPSVGSLTENPPANSVLVVADEPLTGVPASTGDPGDASLLGLIDRLTVLLERSELSELEVRVGGTGLVLRKPSALPAAAAVAPVASPAAGADDAGGAQTAEASAEAPPAERPSVKAPLTGFWYASPSPGSAPYVTPGGEVAIGQVIGLIEAMKLFNEIKSDMAGRVVKVHAEDGKLVKAKQPLIEVEPL